MPAVKAKGHSKKAVSKAVGKNIHRLAHSAKGKNMSQRQRIAVAYSEARGGKKK